MSVQTFERHPKTGLPVQQVPKFEVGDLVTEHIMSDGYPGVVVHATPKTVYVASVDYVLGNVRADDVPGYNGYGDSATLAVDPESVEAAVKRGKEGASKYVLYVSPRPEQYGSLRDRETYGGDFHRARWRQPGGGMYLTKGAKYRQDPHV